MILEQKFYKITLKNKINLVINAIIKDKRGYYDKFE